ncbi:MAG: hypothetical protein JWM51_795 [Microbacteriaceae bacterium]|jgi:threonine dehydrogenase-like Zn-dependent dehydrogenase|nr:hypothetical protein [Microbacteriaceae bacterium]
MTETTTANVWVSKGVVEQQRIAIPEIPATGLLIEVTANGICGTDAHLIGSQPSAPLVLGHEIVGRIVAFGSTHSRRDAADAPLVEGDAIALFPWLPCLVCWGCRRFGPAATTCSNPFVYGIPPEALGLPPLAERAASADLSGGFGRHLIVKPGTYFWRVPEGMPHEIAALLDPLAVAVRSVDVMKTAPGTWDEVIRPDSTAVVLGAGAIGLLAAMVLQSAGVTDVIVSGSRASRLGLAREICGDSVLDIHALDAAERRQYVLDRTGGRGADIVIDATNQPASLGEALGLVRRLGTVVEVGNIVSEGKTLQIDPAEDICQKNVRLLGVAANPPQSYSEAMALLARHEQLPFERLISSRHSFADLPNALEDLAGDTVKVMLVADRN